MPLSPNIIPKKMNTFSVSISTCVVLGGQDMNVFSYSLDFHLCRSRWSRYECVLLQSRYHQCTHKHHKHTWCIKQTKRHNIELNESSMTCKSSFLTIFFWYLRLPISRHQINTSINQKAKGVRFFFFKPDKVPTYFVDQT